MKYFLGLDDTGRILASTDMKEYSEGMIEFDLPNDFDFLKQNNYRIIDGVLTYDPADIPIESQISDLKFKLYETDYVVIKMYESSISNTFEISEADTERYLAIIEDRKRWREEINRLEKEMADKK